MALMAGADCQQCAPSGGAACLGLGIAPSEIAAHDALLAALPHPAWIADLAGGLVLAANRAAEGLFGHAAGGLLGQVAAGLLASPEDMAWWAGAAAGELLPLHSDTLVGLPHGGPRLVSRSIAVIGGGGTQILVMLQDRSAEQRLSQERDSLLAELQATLESTADGFLVTDAVGRITAFNQRFAQLWSLPADLLQTGEGSAVQGWMASSVTDPQDYLSRLQALRLDPTLQASDPLTLRTGQTFERVTRPLLADGRVQGRVWSFRDLTSGIAAQERIETMALTDALTGLPNRRQLSDCVAQATHGARRSGGSFALMLIDLDRFRHINDSLGYDNGDRVLLDVAQRIQGCLRQDDVLARVGGDQFAVLVGTAGAPAAEATARRVLAVVAKPCSVDGATFTLTCSIGIALAPAHGSRIDDLSRHAEAAMRASKHAGRACFRLHQARAEGDRRFHMQLDHAMRQALVSNRFRLRYQPLVDLASGAIVGAEALLRWRDPELGEVPPGRFIPVAEESGFIVAIGGWVLSQAVRQAALWHHRGLSVPVAVNVSALQFQQPQFVERVASVLAVAGLPAALLELELTESILLHDAADALQRVHALARLGVRLAIDDFGTGYSSLAYLKRLPVGKLKIDRSFVTGLPDEGGDAGIVRAILQMARALGMAVVAEGVETEPQRAFLQAAGCDQFQGFLFAPALDSLSFESRLLASRCAERPPAAQGVMPERAAGAAHIRLVSG
ncbi:MAG: EAL domain-containing protein [Rubrivivax sp.]